MSEAPVGGQHGQIVDWRSPHIAIVLERALDAATKTESHFLLRATGDDEIPFVATPWSAAGAPKQLRLAAETGGYVIRRARDDDLTLTGDDRELAAVLEDPGVGFAIIDADGTLVCVVQAPDPVAPTPLDLEAIEAFFTMGGALAGVVDDYEVRSVQVDMARDVAGAFNGSRVVVVEAGTGVGKSLAYSLPAVRWAVINEEPVVISTSTNNLQEQLINADLRLLSEAGLVFEAAILLGRRNYACLRKADEIRQNPDRYGDKEETSDQLDSLASWAFDAEDATLLTLNPPPEPHLWGEMACASDDCTRKDCPFYDKCHYYRARSAAHSADIIVVNHHLLLADLLMRRSVMASSSAKKLTADIAAAVLCPSGGVLPPFRLAVLDEAHHLEDVATDFAARRITSLGLVQQLGRLRRRSDPDRGLLPLLVARLAGIREEASRWSGLSELDAQTEARAQALQAFIEKKVADAVEGAGTEIRAQFDALDRLVASFADNTALPQRVRITDDIETTSEWRDGTTASYRPIRAVVDELTTLLEALVDGLKAFPSEHREALASAIADIDAVRGRLRGATKGLGWFFNPGDDAGRHVRWAERGKASGDTARVALTSAPLDVGPMLFDVVFDALRGTVLTSATLTVGGSFNFFSSRSGLQRLDPSRLVCHAAPSPFDFHEQATVLIAEDLPNPNEKSHAEEVAKLLAPVIASAGGRTLVLLTSYKYLERLQVMLEALLARQRINVRYQGQASRGSLLSSLRGGTGEALVATSSFWEGVDVRGEALSVVAIVRLPFPVPTDPIIEARGEWIERLGGDGFTDLALPLAVIRFKQGMGRLIRHRDDRGLALVLDPRIKHQAYGQVFFDSLSWGEPRVLSAEKVRAYVDRWCEDRWGAKGDGGG